MTELSFTKQAILKLPIPTKGRDYYQDTKEKGLSLYITKSGVVTFFVRKRIHGRDERVILGHFPDITVENARKMALQAKAEVASGKNPNAEKKRLRQDITFGDMFKEFFERYSKLQKKTWKADERDIPRVFGHFFKRKASQISREEILRLHEKMGMENGIYQANRCIQRFSAIYNKAIEWGWEGQNPARGIKKFKEKSRERFLQSDELPRFFQALAEEENTTARDFFLIALLTGARRGNVLAMRWEEINFSINQWHIPETKNGDGHTIPLSPAVIDILQQRLEREGLGNGFVFAGKGKTGHLIEPKTSWKRVLQRANIDNLRLHDLRRTLGSWMAANGATTAIIGKTLAHKTQQATKVYERLNLDPVRLSVEAAHKAMLTAAGVKIHEKEPT